MSFDWQIRNPVHSDPTVPVRVLGRDYFAWDWKDAPENRRNESIFSKLEDELQVHPLHLEKIRILSKQDSANIVVQLINLQVFDTLPCVKSLEVNRTNSKNETREIREWLYKLGIAFQTPVVVLQYYDEVAMLTTWKMVVRYADDWEWVSTDFWVFDEAYTWAVFFCHEDVIAFYGQNPQSVVASDQLE